MTWTLTPQYKLSPQLEKLRKRWGGEAIQYNGQIALKNSNGIFFDSGAAIDTHNKARTFDINSGHFTVNNPIERGKQRLQALIPKYGGHVRHNSSGNWELVNNNGIFYASGAAKDNQGRQRTFNINTGHFTDGLSSQENQQKSPDSRDKTSTQLDQKETSELTTQRTYNQSSWINKNRGIWNYRGGVSQADVANAYKTGNFSKVSNYLTQHKDLANYLNNMYSKRGGNQFGQQPQQQPTTQAPAQETPSYGIHVGDNGVTYTDSNGTTTDVTNSHNLRETIWGINSNPISKPTVNTQFLEQTASNLISPNQAHFGRRGTKDFMTQQGLNPDDYSASERRAFRHSINNDTGDWSGASRIMSDARINNKLKQAVGPKFSALSSPQLGQPEVTLPTNNLVSLKFKQGGQMFKYQQGGQAQQTNGQQGIEQQAIALVQAAMQGDQQANQTIQQIMQAAQQGDQQALQVAQLLQVIIQKMQGSRKARLGAKLNYFKQASECPEGQEVVYFKKGGEICKVCQGKKMQKGGKSDPVSNFKKKREQEQLKRNYQRNPATRGKSAKEIAEMQRKNREEASQGKGESPAPRCSVDI